MNSHFCSSLPVLISVFAFFGFQKDAISQQEAENYVEFTWSNDFWYFPDPSDKHYTNGIYVDMSLEDVGIKSIDFSLVILPEPDESSFGFALTQNIYTPENKETTDLILSDRPFASYLTAHFYKVSLDRNTGKKMRSEWQIGILGRAAGGGATQNFIHSFIPTSEEVAGWVNEVRTDVLINYNLSTESRIFRTKWLESWASLDFRLGSLFTDLTGGLNLQAGLFDSRFDNLWGWMNSSKFRASLVGGARLRLIAYDATVTGGLFHQDSRFRNNYDQNKTQVLLEVGSLLTYGKTAFKFSIFKTSPVIRGGKSHAWGTASFQYLF